MLAEEDLIKILRDYRHIYMNDLQVIMGYIQLGQQDRAVEYIKKISRVMDAESRIYRIKDTLIQYVLIKGYNKARENYIVLTIEIGDVTDVIFNEEDYSTIEKELGKYVSRAILDGNDELYLKLTYNGSASLERIG
ncbi:MAG: Spo0B domain-containing protein [Thermoanaerobacteraceae bacterium]|nr:Spo0B domain-containing protein [Thermoanaerobacteraceae bacterium]